MMRKIKASSLAELCRMADKLKLSTEAVKREPRVSKAGSLCPMINLNNEDVCNTFVQ